MSVPSLKILCRYEYDPLDRLTGVGVSGTQRFYQEQHLVTELGEQTQRTIFRHQAQPLAQQTSSANSGETTLLVTDRAHSLLQASSSGNAQQFAFTAYGHHPAESSLSRLLGFNGEHPDVVTGHYPLGQGNRFYNPKLMRFNSPDELGPFDEGAGLNAYIYCGGDPINFVDITGNTRFFIENLLRGSVIVKPSIKQIKPTTTTIARSVTSNAAKRPLQKSADTISKQKTAVAELASTSVRDRQKGGSQSTVFKRELRKDAKRYDQYILEHPQTKIEKNSQLQAKMDKARQELIQATTAGAPAKELDRLVNLISYRELQIKRDGIRKIDLRGKQTSAQ
ncbi:RHS repeat-associated core domain-containing protein [Pseudomonas sp. 14P_8.1_Bac3]|uniref:RHS repeat-associated core domain-containing protein n=1 Tax=Pseudomonas sp. 14P_8.1_Bac3 TaxID=2971621 RepID=UPI0021C8CE7E|nr:RHS repeat-associated core domain-containing protein [Pseudomonas sp. 14P_8.1_Bac3]MCU1759423.1 RHS repeat-associated core domain-containing protein [Pseudomonas sp. 14P_8.1_Bac3]